MQDLFERRVLDLQSNLKEKEDRVQQLESEHDQLKKSNQELTHSKEALQRDLRQARQG